MLQSKCRHSTALPLETCAFCGTASHERLLDLCLGYVTRNWAAVGALALRPGVDLPVEVCERLLDAHAGGSARLGAAFIRLFEERPGTRLKRVRLRDTDLADADLRVLLAHELLELEVAASPRLTPACLDDLTVFGSQLASLSLCEPKLFPVGDQERHLSRDYVFLAPSLKKLTIRNLPAHQPRFFTVLLQSFPALTHLDLSNCNVGPFTSAEHLAPTLVSLILYNCLNPETSVDAICRLTNLRHLDVSQAKVEDGLYENGNETLALLVRSLRHLNSLDISGTNLAGRGFPVHCLTEKMASDIPGLEARGDRPFHYLGLYDTSHDACLRHDIPAKLIAGNANEEQILVAALAYIERTEMLQKVLNELFHLLRFETCRHVGQALNIVLEAMGRHLQEKHVQISGSATLFYIVKGTGKELHEVVHVKRRIIKTLLNGMSLHRHDETMMRNGCLTLCQFKIPGDVLFDYERLVDILLHSVSGQQETFVQRIGIYLLNSLACQVDGHQKVKLGELGAINRMMELISYRLNSGYCDDVLEVAWSTMWNVTDETPLNCHKFLEFKGMDFFLSCLEKFPHKEELLRNMMGLLGNVAEVRHLRQFLMQSEYLTVFSNLLDSYSDGIEVSYNAAGVISHIASDGPDVWTVSQPSRDDVLTKMMHAIDRWDIESQRNINYRSFEPILYLVNVYDTPECQKWAVWALANLTKVYPEKYCALIEKEGGLFLLNDLLNHPLPPLSVKQLSALVIEHCRVFKEESSEDAQLDG